MLCFLFLCLILINTTISCPAGFFEWQNGCYSFKSNATEFADAESECIKNGGHLTSIHDGFTNAWITQEASKYFVDSTVTDFWIGSTDLIHSGNWSWTDGTFMDFIETLQNSTNSTLTGLDCISVTLTNGKWQKSDCFKTKPYVCKSGKPVYPAFENCTGPYIYYQPTHSCYGDPTERQLKNWAMSEDICLSHGGHLPSIHSANEINFLEALLMISATNIWVGATSVDNGLNWRWSDNTPWDYNPWASGYPNLNTSGCGIFWGGGIRDMNCNESRTLICQIKL